MTVDKVDKVVIFNDKSWVRFSEYTKLEIENRELKNSIEKMKKKIMNLIYDDNSIDEIVSLLEDWKVLE